MTGRHSPIRILAIIFGNVVYYRYTCAKRTIKTHKRDFVVQVRTHLLTTDFDTRRETQFLKVFHIILY